MRPFRNFLFVLIAALGFGAFAMTSFAQEQTPGDFTVPPPPHAKQIHLKHVLVIGETKGFEHDSVSDAMAAIYTMGEESGLWDTTMRTDTELLTKKDLPRNAKNLNYFDALVFASTTGELDMDASQKHDMMSFIKEDGKGFCRNPRGAGYELHLAGIRRDDWRVVRPASLEYV